MLAGSKSRGRAAKKEEILKYLQVMHSREMMTKILDAIVQTAAPDDARTNI